MIGTRSIAEVIEAAMSDMPYSHLHWSIDLHTIHAQSVETANVLAAWVALNQLTIDDAYKLAKVAAQSNMLRTGSWKPMFRDMTTIIDRSTVEIAAYIESTWDQASDDMFMLATPMVRAGRSQGEVGDELIRHAQTVIPTPPPEILAGALNRAIATVRGNERWMTGRLGNRA